MVLSDYDFFRLKGMVDRLRESQRVDRRQLADLEAKLAA